MNPGYPRRWAMARARGASRPSIRLTGCLPLLPPFFPYFPSVPLQEDLELLVAASQLWLVTYTNDLQLQQQRVCTHQLVVISSTLTNS
jgi:hypothetical protein